MTKEYLERINHQQISQRNVLKGLDFSTLIVELDDD